MRDSASRIATSTLPSLESTTARQIRKLAASATQLAANSAARVPSACIAGVAGALYVPQVGIINPSEFAPANSIEAVIWVAVGGRGTLIGAALGAVVVNYAKTVFTSGPLAPYWLFLLGALFVLVTLLMPKGLLGTWHAWYGRRKPAPTAGATPSDETEFAGEIAKPHMAE